MENEIIKFDPSVEKLNEIVASVKNIGLTDFENKEQYEAVKRAQIDLGKLRTDIEKFAKGKRDYYTKINRDIRDQELKYLAIIGGEETRLKELRKQADEFVLKKKRAAQLPERRAKIDEVYPTAEIFDNELLGMDDTQFISYLNELKSQKLTEDQAKLEAEKQALAIEQKKIADEKTKNEAIEKARKEEREQAKKREENLRQEAILKEQKAEQDKKDFEARHKKEMKESEDRAKKAESDRLQKIEDDKKEKARLEKEEKARMKKDEDYQSWLKKNKYDPKSKDMMITKEKNTVILWTKKSVYDTE